MKTQTGLLSLRFRGVGQSESPSGTLDVQCTPSVEVHLCRRESVI